MVKHIPAKAAVAYPVSEVNADEKEPRMGSKLAEGILIAVYMREESYFKRDAVGDGGASLGSLQLQRVGLTSLSITKSGPCAGLRPDGPPSNTAKAKSGRGKVDSLVSGNCHTATD